MGITIRQGPIRREVDAGSAATLLDVLRDAGMPVSAPCGGGGTCGKCRVRVRGEDGWDFLLACETEAVDGMEVAVGQSLPMEVSAAGATEFSRRADGSAKGLGIAVDVGTTTLVCRLVDCATGEVLASRGRPNPQGAFGADVVSRIAAASSGHLQAMRTALLEELDAMASELVDEAEESRSAVGRMVLAGNTTMQSIAAGLDPSPIGVAPFCPPSLFGGDLPLEPVCERAFFAPCIAGYVGGDVTCDLLAADVLSRESPTLLLDLGTNGEMALGDSSGTVACATAAGPVFEGAGIKFGMPAYPGAVSQVRLVDGRIEIETVGRGRPKGICGTGLVDAVALMLDEGVLDEGGCMLDADEVPPHMAIFMGEDEDGPVFCLSPGLHVTQRDVRHLQLAKAAVRAGVLVLLDERGISAHEVEELLVAGGFGEHLNLKSAVRIGLFPAELLPVAKSVGNISIEGASAVLFSEGAARDLDRIAGSCRYVELSLSRSFNEYYMDSMVF